MVKFYYLLMCIRKLRSVFECFKLLSDLDIAFKIKSVFNEAYVFFYENINDKNLMDVSLKREHFIGIRNQSRHFP